MTQLGALFLGRYSLIIVVGLAVYHSFRFVKKEDKESEMIVTLMIPVLIYLANVAH